MACWCCCRLRFARTLVPFVLVLMVLPGAAGAQAEGDYVFGWPFVEPEAIAPRGGTTEGPAVELVQEPTEAFQRLQGEGINPRERDRRAILALAGAHRVSFDFLEVMGYSPDFEPAAPYRSWGYGKSIRGQE